LRAGGQDDQLKGGLTIKVTHKDEMVATLKANRFRPDVAQALEADPYCGFIFDPPYQLRRASPWFRSYVAALRAKTAAKRSAPALRARTAKRRKATGLADWPLVSVICPTYRPEIDDFKAAVESVIAQTYNNWELIVVDDGSDDAALSAFIKGVTEREPRIRHIMTPKNLGISGATNLALDAAGGEWIALFDHDDLLVDVALEIMMSEARRSGAAMLYSDEDKIDTSGYYCEPALKPDWNYRLLLSCNYICHLLVVRTRLIEKAGKLRTKYDGAQDHDLVLRLSELIPHSEILHVPEILYHWRKTSKSPASGITAKTYAINAGVNAVTDHLARIGKPANVTEVLKGTMYCVKWESEEEPFVHIVIPYRDQAGMTAKCLDAVLGLTSYRNFRITLVDNWSVKPETQKIMDKYLADSRIAYIRVEEEYNYSRLNNMAANMCDSDFIFLMNNDLIVVDPDWLRVVVNEALANESVGAVGGKFLYPDGTVQHGGVVLGLWGIAGHVHTGLDADAPGYGARALLAQELSAVTAAGMLVRTDVFRRIGGLDEENLKIAFNDIDLCLKIREAGYKIIMDSVLCR
jgi:GT2 family glycosyltransferase